MLILFCYHFWAIYQDASDVLCKLNNITHLVREKTIDNYIPLAKTYQLAIVTTNKSVIKEWKLNSDINLEKYLFCNSTQCAYRQLPNLQRILVKSILSRIPSLFGSSKCMKPRCQVLGMFDARTKLQFPETSYTIQPGNCNCDSHFIVYSLMYEQCDSGNNIRDTSNKLRFRHNNRKKSIRDNSRVFSGGSSFQPTRPF